MIATIIGMVGAKAYAQDGTVREQSESGRPRSLVGHYRPLGVVAFNPDGSRVAVVEEEGAVNLYDATSGRVLWRAADPQRALVYSLAFSSDGSRIAAGGLERWEAVDRYGGGRPGEPHVGSVIIVGKGGKVRVWEAADGREVRTIARLPLGVRFVNLLGPGGARITTVDTDFRVTVHALDTGQVVLAMHDLAAHGRGQFAPGITAAFGADGRRIVLQCDPTEGGGRPGIRLNVWDLEGRRARQLDLPPPASGPVALGPDGTRLFVGEHLFVAGASPGMRARAERWLRERDLASGEVVVGPAPMRIQLVMGGMLAFSPDGGLIVTAGWEGRRPGEAETLMVWDSRTGRRLREIRETHGRILAVAFLTGRVRVASGGDYSTERDPATGRLKATPVTIWEFELSR